MVISFSQRYETVADLVGNAVRTLWVLPNHSRSFVFVLFLRLACYRSSIVSLGDIMLVPPVSQRFLRMCKGIEPLHRSLAVREALEEIRAHSDHLDSGLALWNVYRCYYPGWVDTCS